ncbi:MULTISPECIES: 3-isopropylmalate dehydrogenase [unclassified Rothia (in: high G+C Gram-positive bacteria)]|uniref:3-isopropylmalate dehydrogenase n=1 Tax=unclassified Rothia (in: high G+C Gram-positive bacteria) TaxID=2689056 RepID=UPI001958094B|nr:MULTISPECIES: 3-isopropylmalate dehydrogenase [unclassified Rothia (in: high G+C Gram-positive bacteria)]MBM7050949.1 3-isopropylmalate dehydrogenase [Rothia sp. ZJ1223]QRZ62320.1 3-isopropylmalate dehydrogenase [Rothia sp. ZJ932]
MTETRSLNLAVIPGDGIGPEVVAQALRVLEKVASKTGLDLAHTEYPLGAEHWLATGETLTEETMEKLGTHDAILFGAVGADPRSSTIPSGLIEREMLLKLRFTFDHYINLRPSKLYPGVTSPLSNPGGIDFVVVREGTEGPYAGNGGRLRPDTDQEIATEVSLNTAHGVERLIRYAFELANSREKKKLTLIHKTNVLVNAGKLYSRYFNAVAAEYPDVTVDYLHIDAATIFMTTDPARFDVIVTDNLFGDIITDQAGAITGGIGYAASGNINASGTYPSMFEPVHGSAPDIAGQNIANPTAAILAAGMLLNHLGYTEQARMIEDAVEKDLAANVASSRSTIEVGDAILQAL